MNVEKASISWQGSEVGLKAIWPLSQTQINEKAITKVKSTENLLANCHSPNKTKDSSSINNRSKRFKNKNIWIKFLSSVFIHPQKPEFWSLMLYLPGDRWLYHMLSYNPQLPGFFRSPINHHNCFLTKVFRSLSAKTVLLLFS